MLKRDLMHDLHYRTNVHYGFVYLFLLPMEMDGGGWYIHWDMNTVDYSTAYPYFLLVSMSLVVQKPNAANRSILWWSNPTMKTGKIESNLFFSHHVNSYYQ
jgi:hypothetical protein